MKKFIKLKRAEMKNVFGGLVDPGTGGGGGGCRSDADCTSPYVCTGQALNADKIGTCKKPVITVG